MALLQEYCTENAVGVETLLGFAMVGYNFFMIWFDSAWIFPTPRRKKYTPHSILF